MKRLFIKALKIQHQQEALFVLGIFSCIIGAILFEYDKLKYSETCMGICLICFILLLINAWLNPYIKKSLNKNYMSIADGDDYVEAKQVMRGNGKDHYLGLSQKKRKKSLLGRIKW